MLEIFLNNINPIKILVTISFLFGFFFLNRKKPQHKLFLLILGCGFATEYGVFVCYYFDQKIDLLYSISFMAHNILWLLLLQNRYRKLKYFRTIICCYFIFSVVNLFFLEKDKLNYMTFITGGLIYLGHFIKLSYIELRDENVAFFVSNDYLMLFIPVPFFIGFSLMFGFRDNSLFYEKIFSSYNLYGLICNLSVINYHLLAIIYTYRLRNKNLKWIQTT